MRPIQLIQPVAAPRKSAGLKPARSVRARSSIFHLLFAIALAASAPAATPIKNGVVQGTFTIKADQLSANLIGVDAGSTDTYACNLGTAITAYVAGTQYSFKANTANTGAATINFNGLGAKTIVKYQGGAAQTLSNNDIRAGAWVIVMYDGTNMQLVSTLGNGGGGGGSGDLVSTNNLSDVASASTSRTNLGLAIGTNVQAYDADLTTYAGITPSANIQTLLGSADFAAARTNLGLAIGTNVQAYHARLAAIAANTGALDISGTTLTLPTSTALTVPNFGTGVNATVGVDTALGYLVTHANSSASTSFLSQAGTGGSPAFTGIHYSAADGNIEVFRVGYGGSLFALGDIDLGHASDTTIHRVSAGVVSIEGVTIATASNSLALTGKTYNGLTITTSSGTLTIANSKTLTVSNTLTFTGTDGSSVAFGAGGTVLYSGGALGTPSSGTLTNCTFPTLNQNTTGSAASLSVSGQTGLVTITGLASTNRVKTVRDAADTILELGGSYTPTGTWTSMTLVTPALGTPASGTLTNCTGYTIGNLTVASQAQGDIIYYNGSNWVRLGAGTSGHFLKTQGAGANPTWAAAAAAATIETLTDAATVTPDSTNAGGLLATLSQNTTIANPTGSPSNFQTYKLRIKSTTSRTLTWGSQFRFSVDLPSIAATSGSSLTDYFVFQWNSADSKWDCVGKNFGF